MDLIGTLAASSLSRCSYCSSLVAALLGILFLVFKLLLKVSNNVLSSFSTVPLILTVICVCCGRNKISCIDPAGMLTAGVFLLLPLILLPCHSPWPVSPPLLGAAWQ